VIIIQIQITISKIITIILVTSLVKSDFFVAMIYNNENYANLPMNVEFQPSSEKTRKSVSRRTLCSSYFISSFTLSMKSGDKKTTMQTSNKFEPLT